MKMNFAREKCNRLKGLDLSRKGSVDDRITEFLKFINGIDCFYTTSSCSGRIVILSSSTECFLDCKPDANQTKNSGDQEFPNPEGCEQCSGEITRNKKGCNWLLVSHEILKSGDAVDALKDHKGSAVLKFEPFILHLRCSSLPDAQKMHAVCTASGFRNSGLTVSKTGKITLAVRSTMTLEVPLSQSGALLVSNEYLDFLVEEANKKMKENWLKTKRLFDNTKLALEMPLESENLTLKNEACEGHSKKKKSNIDFKCISDS